ncbi:hypothetical protein [Glutamicibacter protophormiae]|uniref:Uncharacterized protein n=1 Tax=Glutamicibacter protophormiae TaxID=37930 RepID=A0ABS4XPZ1_GLUPR|nr:hypothetical protein [Glutamicibacter protophormiae]MBP2398420.1 hypothetical protein [Glutamicibacter protophormiae]QRQ79197.1 hypothetical protein JQN66_02785 [Glutamicibacter protophormiae]GGL98521.1 hypothetical protein GCM10010038_30760 [Glutamicibacter protophormiae]
MAFFSRLRAQRAANRELGEGVWRRAHDRFTRSLDRIFQVLEGINDVEIYNQLVAPANEMAELLPVVRQLCTDAQRITPSDDEAIPQSTAGVHRSLTKSANDLATTAQVIAMMRMQAEAGSPINILSVEHRAQIVKDDVNQAAQLLASLK